MTENQSENPLNDITLSRRDLFKLTGAGFLGLALTQSPAVAEGAAAPEAEQAPATEAAAVQEVEPQTNGWNLPIVEGEVLEIEPVINAELREFIGDIFLRNQPEAVGATGTTPVGSILRVDKANVPGQNGDPHTWDGGDLVFDGTAVIQKAVDSRPTEEPDIEEVTTWVATDIPNTTRLITEPSQVPEPLKPFFITTPTGLKPSLTEFDQATIISTFNSVGGNEEVIEQMVKAWGKEYVPEEPADITPWQRAVTTTAIEGITDESSRPINICEFIGDATSTCNFYRRIDPKTGLIDVISRFVNPDIVSNPDIFSITRFRNTRRDGLKVVGTGFTTAAGFVNAYGTEADTIATSLTSVSGEGTVDLAQEINSDPNNAKVFLPSINAFVDKWENGSDPSYHRVINDQGAVMYRAVQRSNEGTLMTARLNGKSEWVTEVPETMAEYASSVDQKLGTVASSYHINKPEYKKMITDSANTWGVFTEMQSNEMFKNIDWQKIIANWDEVSGVFANGQIHTDLKFMMNTSNADNIVNKASAEGKTVFGGEFIWGNTLPEAIYSLDNAGLRKALELITKAKALRYKGKVHAWSLNEVAENITWGGNDRGRIYSRLGEGIVEDICRWKQEVDPDSIIVFNEAHIDQVDIQPADLANGARATRNKYMEMVANLYSKGLIQAAGIQGHHWIGDQPNPAYEEETVRYLTKDIGIPVWFTEETFNIGNRDPFYNRSPKVSLNMTDEEKLRIQAEHFSRRLALAHKYGAAYMIFQSADFQYDIFNGAYQMPEARAHIFDENFEPKPAYFALDAEIKKEYEQQEASFKEQITGQLPVVVAS